MNELGEKLKAVLLTLLDELEEDIKAKLDEEMIFNDDFYKETAKVCVHSIIKEYREGLK